MRKAFAEDNKDYLSKNNSDCLKGIFAIFVLMHHLYQHSGLFYQTSLGTMFQAMGYLSVAVFFFLSGYGLMLSYRKKGDQYIREFPKKRIIPFYCVILLGVAIYAVLTLIIGDNFEITTVISSFVFGGTIIVNGWYLQVQLLLYIVFFVTFSAFKNKSETVKLTAMALVILLYTVIMSLFFANVWYESVFAFLMGMLWPVFRSKIDPVVSSTKKWILLTVAVAIMFGVLFLLGSLFPIVPIRIMFKAMSAITFVLLTAMIMIKLPIACAVTKFLGKISMEIYMLQGVFLLLFHSRVLYIENPYVYVLAVTAGTFGMSLLLHPLNVQIFKLFSKGKMSRNV